MKNLLACLALVSCAAPAALAQWPGWGGPNGNFTLAAGEIATTWPADGPRQLWKQKLGEGNSGIAVSDGVLFTLYRKGDTENVVALRTADGESVWKHKYKAPLWDDFFGDYGKGPHATPLVNAGRVFAVGIRGTLHCLDEKTGDVKWTHELWDEFGGKPNLCGHAASPIAYGDTIILPAGGKGHAVVALRQDSGEKVWASGDFENAYASPALINVDGQDQVVAFMANVVAGFDAKTGALRWSHAHATKYGTNASTPVWGSDNILFCSSAYEAGSRALKLTRDGESTGVQELWFNNKIKIHHGNAIRVGDVLYGSNGDFGPAFLFGVNVPSGEIVFQQRGFAKANLLRVGETFVLLDEDGKAGVATLGGEGFNIHASAELLKKTAWTAPTLVDRTLFVRDNKHVAAFDLGA